MFSFEAGTPVSTPGREVSIESLSVGDRVVAQSVDVAVGAVLPTEPLSSTCAEVGYVSERLLGPDEVLVYAPVSGQWSVVSRGRLTQDSTWWSDGALHHGGQRLGRVSIEALRLADASYEASPHHEAPCPSAWVLVLGEGAAHHARLAEVSDGSRIAYGGRVLRTGPGRVRPTGEVLSQVVDTFSRTSDGVFELEVEGPDGSLTWLSATAEHPFYAVEAGKYVSVRHLEVGARLHVEGGGEALLVSKTWRQGGVEVFNVEVAGEHNYFAAGVLTHNAKKNGCGSQQSCPIDPKWGVNRVIKELYRNGYKMNGPTRGQGGFMWSNAEGGRVRIMPKPRRRPFRGESPDKFANRFYYRFKKCNQPEGPHTTIPDK